MMIFNGREMEKKKENRKVIVCLIINKEKEQMGLYKKYIYD